ncbi:hypothetical protein GGG16DRAFT_94712 [Schizophyllum commune]
MVHVLGIPLNDHHFARFALTNIYGVGRKTAHRICARLQIHNRCRVKNLTPLQITQLASFLSSPQTSPPAPKLPLADPFYKAPPPETNMAEAEAKLRRRQQVRQLQGARQKDPLYNLRIESELRREIRENIAHQRMIGSYVGLRHAMHLPVRGQNTQSNAKTAKKLNQLDRW